MDERGCFARSMYADGMRKGCSSVVYLIRSRGAQQCGADGGGSGGGGERGYVWAGAGVGEKAEIHIYKARILKISLGN